MGLACDNACAISYAEALGLPSGLPSFSIYSGVHMKRDIHIDHTAEVQRSISTALHSYLHYNPLSLQTKQFFNAHRQQTFMKTRHPGTHPPCNATMQVGYPYSMSQG